MFVHLVFGWYRARGELWRLYRGIGVTTLFYSGIVYVDVSGRSSTVSQICESLGNIHT